jgi:hypothetical protein
MNEKQKAAFIKALSPTELGPVVASRTMNRLRADGVMDTVTIEIGTPRPIDVPNPADPKGSTLWSCNARISGLPHILSTSGMSSLDAIISAVYLVSRVLSNLPFASEIDMSLLPYFGLPVNPVTTTPEQLNEEQKREKKISVNVEAISAKMKDKSD